ncbi:spore coat protein [archaeon]|nr:spore coat protein [archaeon]
MVKGIVPAGGLGTRLMPLTAITHKHLLPVYDQLMIFYPLKSLIKAGIKDIMIITSPECENDYKRVLGNGESLGINLSYAFQEKPGGIAQAVGLAKDFVGKDKCVVLLGDNIFEDDITEAVENFKNQEKGARIFLKACSDAYRYAVAEVKDNKVISLIEKPKPEDAKSNLGQTGLYMYDNQLFDIISTLKPSKRGELEITDVQNQYLTQGTLEYEEVKGYWIDAGTIDSLYDASKLIRDKKKE